MEELEYFKDWLDTVLVPQLQTEGFAAKASLAVGTTGLPDRVELTMARAAVAGSEGVSPSLLVLHKKTYTPQPDRVYDAQVLCVNALELRDLSEAADSPLNKGLALLGSLSASDHPGVEALNQHLMLSGHGLIQRAEKAMSAEATAEDAHNWQISPAGKYFSRLLENGRSPLTASPDVTSMVRARLESVRPLLAFLPELDTSRWMLGGFEERTTTSMKTNESRSVLMMNLYLNDIPGISLTLSLEEGARAKAQVQLVPGSYQARLLCKAREDFPAFESGNGSLSTLMPQVEQWLATELDAALEEPAAKALKRNVERRILAVEDNALVAELTTRDGREIMGRAGVRIEMGQDGRAERVVRLDDSTEPLAKTLGLPEDLLKVEPWLLKWAESTRAQAQAFQASACPQVTLDLARKVAVLTPQGQAPCEIPLVKCPVSKGQMRAPGALKVAETYHPAPGATSLELAWRAQHPDEAPAAALADPAGPSLQDILQVAVAQALTPLIRERAPRKKSLER